MQAKISKFIAAVLALVIIFANSWSVVSYAAEVFLSEKELENQNTTSKDGSVDFDVQYTNGKHSATLNIDEKNTKLNIAVSLKKFIHRGMEQLAARWAHNPKVGSSSLSPATKYSKL